ncbi:MAG TPA: hypothetical protein VNO75_09555 [Gemmatimonadaceae bacterium]|nr:hypothetical protein [Gemmatimonadaceae bacterium]
MRLKAVPILFLTAIVTTGAASTSLSAQESQLVGAQAPDTAAVNTATHDPRFLVRVLPAVGVGLAGTFLGGLVGLMGGGCLCGDGLGFISTTLLAGATIGSAVGAAAPKGRGICTDGQRFRRALAGATLGLASTLAIARNDPDRIAVAATIPLGSVMLMTKC